MKIKSFKTGLLACGLVVLATVHAPAGDSNTKLDEAVGLMNNHRPKEARAVLATVDKADPVFATAKGLDALYQLDKKQFYDRMRTQELATAEWPEAVREDLDFKNIDTLLFYRKFEELLPKIGEFSDLHAGSPRAEMMVEYQLAALYERGMKNLRDATFTRAGKGKDDAANTAERMQAGQDNLEQFLKLAAEGDRNNYQTLTNRDLAAEVVKAMTALGGEKEALNQVPVAEREDMALALVQLHNKIDADAAGANLQRMTNFLNDFPESKYRPRVLYEMADFALKEAQRFAFKERDPVKAAPYLEMAHNVFSHVVEDKKAGVLASDVQEAREKMLMVYLQEEDYTTLSRWAAQLVTNTPVGSRMWLAAKLYDAYGLVYQKKFGEAAVELDEILATGFKGIPTSDGLLVSAAQWRMQVARHTKDEATMSRIAEQVQNSNCYTSLKRTFMSDYKKLFQSKTVSK